MMRFLFKVYEYQEVNMEEMVGDANAFQVPHDDSDEGEETLPQQALDIDADRDEQDCQNNGLHF